MGFRATKEAKNSRRKKHKTQQRCFQRMDQCLRSGAQWHHGGIRGLNLGARRWERARSEPGAREQPPGGRNACQIMQVVTETDKTIESRRKVPQPPEKRAGGRRQKPRALVGHRSKSSTLKGWACVIRVRARPPGGPVSLSMHANRGKHRNYRPRLQASCTPTHSTVRSTSTCGRFGYLCTCAPYRTPCLVAGMPKNWSVCAAYDLSCLGCLPLPNRRGRCERMLPRLLIATGLWMPSRFHSVAPKVL